MIRIITDSTSDISQTQAAELGLTIVPLKVVFGEEAFREGIEMTLEQFYARLPKESALPTTSQPTPDEFAAQFREVQQAGDSAVVITISSTLSGTYQSASIAKEMVGYDDIHIIDSRTASSGMRLLIEEGLRLRDKDGQTAADLAAELTDLASRVQLFALVDTLENLHKGGRLSRTSTIAGTLLNFKPIITVKDGALTALGKARGTAAGLEKMFDAIEQAGEIDTNYPCYFGWAATDEKAQICREKASEHFALTKTFLDPIGCVIGTHIGAGACVMTVALRK